ncbi:MAG TPA: hypothetical protein DEA50_01895 [Parvularcula sp.]|nr:hypothetical protein [Parvularcula sp.]
MRVLIVAGNISARMGGEAVIPLHYIRELTALGCEVHALTHARVRAEIQAHPMWRADRFHFIEDAAAEKAIYAAGKKAPGALRETLFMSGVGLVTQRRLAGRARAPLRRRNAGRPTGRGHGHRSRGRDPERRGPDARGPWRMTQGARREDQRLPIGA